MKPPNGEFEKYLRFQNCEVAEDSLTTKSSNMDSKTEGETSSSSLKKVLNIEISPENAPKTNDDHSGHAPNMSTLVRQTSGVKINCLCSPTTHNGSFRCRLHRLPSLHRTTSIDLSGSLESSSPKNSDEEPVNA